MLLSLAERFSFRSRMDRSNAAGPILVWGRGSVVRDIAGKEYLDFNSREMCAALGHNHPRIVQTLQESCEALLHSHMSLFNDREIILASRLAEITPPGLIRSMFLTSGSGIVVAHSHSNDPMTCNAAIASLDIILEEGLVDVAASLGEYWAGHLRALAERHETIGDIRGRGLLQGIEMVANRDTREPAFQQGRDIGRLCLENGLICSVRRNGSVLRFVPPFTTTREQMDLAAEILDFAISSVT